MCVRACVPVCVGVCACMCVRVCAKLSYRYRLIHNGGSVQESCSRFILKTNTFGDMPRSKTSNRTTPDLPTERSNTR